MNAADADGLQRLDDFLHSTATPDDSMGIDQLDGFLSALVCGPVAVPPRRYLPEVWGHPDGPEFASAEQADEILALIAGLRSTIAAALDSHGSYQPLLRSGEHSGGGRIVLTEAWCDGFLRGVVLCQDAWEPHLEPLAAHLDPILDFARRVAESEDLMDQVLRSQAIEVAQVLPACLASIYAYWRSLPSAPSEPAADADCPCGSGRPYRECCAAPLH